MPLIGSGIEYIMDQSIKTNQTTLKDVFKGLLSTIALILFSYDPHAKSEQSKNLVYYGYFLLFISLITDGLLSLKEKLIKKEVENNPNLSEYKGMIAWYIMFILNISVVIIVLPSNCKIFYFSN